MAQWTQSDSPRNAVPGAPAGAAAPWWGQHGNQHSPKPQGKRKQRPKAQPVIRCNIPSQVEMPAKAQKLWDGRKVYVCGLPRDHDGPHRWPADKVTLIAEWD